MGKYKLWIIAVVLLLVSGCSKDDEQFTTWPVPSWSVESPELLPNSFTAVVAVPENLSVYATDNDRIAAFIGEGCHGVGSLVKDDASGKRVYFLTIRASDAEAGTIVFRYYNARLSYMYEAVQTVSFVTDGTYGTYDSPVFLELQNL